MRSCTWINTLSLLCLAFVASACQERRGRRRCGRLAAATQRRAAGVRRKERRSNAAIAGPQMPAAERTRSSIRSGASTRISNYQLIWIDGDRPSSQIPPVREGARRRGRPRPAARASIRCRSTIDSGTTRRFLRSRRRSLTPARRRHSCGTSRHLLGGRLDPRALQSLWTLKPERPDLVNALTTAVKEQRSRQAAMERLQPQQPEYRELQKALVRYRAIAAKGRLAVDSRQHAAQAESAIACGAGTAPATGD